MSMQKIMPEPCKRILSITDEFGGITDKQIKRLLSGIKEESREYYINYLKRIHIEEKKPGYYTAKANKTPFDKQMEFCLWVLLDNLKNDKGEMEAETITYSRTKKPSRISFIKNNICYNVAYIDKNHSGELEQLNRGYLAELPRYQKMKEKLGLEPYRQIFVVGEEGLLDFIESFELALPFIIALVNFDSEGYPNISYFTYD